MNILMLVPHVGTRGGIPLVATHLLNGLRTLGCNIETAPWGRRAEHESISQKLLGRFKDLCYIRRMLKAGNWNVIYVHTAHDWLTLGRDIPLGLLAKAVRMKVVYEFHGSQSSRLLCSGSYWFKKATALLMYLSSGLFVLSRAEREQLRQFYQARHCYVVKNPFSSEMQAHLAGPPASASQVDERPIVLFVGRVIVPKGVIVLLEAIQAVLGQVACRLAIVGDGDAIVEVREKVKKSGLSGVVSIAGYVPRRELLQYYADAAVFVLPTYHDEGNPAVLFEAMAAGLPVVTTQLRGAADHLVNGENALFVQPRSSASLASALLTLLKDPALRDRMGRANAARVRDFAPDVVAPEYIKAFEEILCE